MSVIKSVFEEPPGYNYETWDGTEEEPFSISFALISNNIAFESIPKLVIRNDRTKREIEAVVERQTIKAEPPPVITLEKSPLRYDAKLNYNDVLDWLGKCEFVIYPTSSKDAERIAKTGITVATLYLTPRNVAVSVIASEKDVVEIAVPSIWIDEKPTTEPLLFVDMFRCFDTSPSLENIKTIQKWKRDEIIAPGYEEKYLKFFPVAQGETRSLRIKDAWNDSRACVLIHRNDAPAEFRLLVRVIVFPAERDVPWHLPDPYIDQTKVIEHSGYAGIADKFPDYLVCDSESEVKEGEAAATAPPRVKIHMRVLVLSKLARRDDPRQKTDKFSLDQTRHALICRYDGRHTTRPEGLKTLYDEAMASMEKLTTTVGNCI